MNITNVEHIDFIVADIEKSIEFWMKLGFFPEGTLDDGKSAYLINRDGTLKIELHEGKPGQALGIDHISLEVEDVEASYHEGKFLGIDFHVEPKAVPRSGRTIANFYDHDGTHLQISKKTHRPGYYDWK